MNFTFSIMRNAQAEGTREGDIEKIVENIIYQHLISLGHKVNVGQLQAGEIDFVCAKKAGTKRIYIQAAYIIANDETREREFGNLRNTKDNYPKYVVSMTLGVTRNSLDYKYLKITYKYTKNISDYQLLGNIIIPN